MRLKYFGTAGIRGFTNREITVRLAHRVGLALGHLYGEVLVSRDTRRGSRMLKEALISGIAEAGGTAYDIDVATLPMTASAASDMGLHAVAVTGSHTPPEIEGIVVIDDGGADIYWDESRKIEELIDSPPRPAPGGRIVRMPVPLDAYLQRIEGFIGNPPSGFTVAADVAEGSLSPFLQEVMGYFGLSVKDVESSGTGVPWRHPEPRGDRAGILGAVMEGADLGILTDMDADRVVFVSKEGPLDENSVGAFFASRYARKGSTIVTPINSSGTIVEAARRLGLRIAWCRIGPPEIAHASRVNGADFAYEETGKYMFVRDGFLWGDAVLSTLFMLKVTDGDLSAVHREFPPRAQVRRSVPCPRERMQAVMEAVGKIVRTELADAEILDVDGYKAIFPDSSWLLIRASGTEPVIRVYSEGRDEGRARELSELGLGILRRAMDENPL